MKTSTTIGIFAALAICAGLASPAHADCTEPFASAGELIACSAASASHPTELYLDGHKIAQFPGSGLAVVRQFFNCANIGIKHICNAGALTGGALLAALQDGYLRWQYANAVLGNGVNVYVDGVLTVDRGSLHTLALKTCHGDQSTQGPALYYVVEFHADGFNAPYQGDCF